jgi:predicted RNA-binding Zn-ribbon protein involved in translation (DUF1610 family)
MAIPVVCFSCAARLKVGEQVLGKRIKCPSCGEAFVAAEEKSSAAKAEPDVRITERNPIKKSVEDAVTESLPRKMKPPPLPVEDVEEGSAEEEPPPEDRPRKKKRKKKAKRNPAWALVTAESRPWWLFGGIGILALELLLLALAVFLPSNHPAKFVMAYFFAMLPISTIIFFASMYVASLFGAVEVGEIPVAMVKGFILIAIVNTVSLIPYGLYLAAVIWFVGIMTIFRLDVWETRVLVGINWVLNFIAQIIILTLLATMVP